MKLLWMAKKLLHHGLFWHWRRQKCYSLSTTYSCTFCIAWWGFKLQEFGRRNLELQVFFRKAVVNISDFILKSEVPSSLTTLIAFRAADKERPNILLVIVFLQTFERLFYCNLEFPNFLPNLRECIKMSCRGFLSSCIIISISKVLKQLWLKLYDIMFPMLVPGMSTFEWKIDKNRRCICRIDKFSVSLL